MSNVTEELADLSLLGGKDRKMAAKLMRERCLLPETRWRMRQKAFCRILPRCAAAGMSVSRIAEFAKQAADEMIDAQVRCSDQMLDVPETAGFPRETRIAPSQVVAQLADTIDIWRIEMTSVRDKSEDVSSSHDIVRRWSFLRSDSARGPMVGFTEWTEHDRWQIHRCWVPSLKDPIPPVWAMPLVDLDEVGPTATTRPGAPIAGAPLVVFPAQPSTLEICRCYKRQLIRWTFVPQLSRVIGWARWVMTGRWTFLDGGYLTAPLHRAPALGCPLRCPVSETSLQWVELGEDAPVSRAPLAPSPLW